MGDAGNDQVKKTVYIQVTDSNRIKYEQLSEFSDSLFLRVYAKAFHMLGNLLKENDQFTCITGEKDQIYNVIAFLGERGMGKTS